MGHTNTLVIADRGLPCQPQLESVELSLMDDLPTVLQGLAAVRGSWVVGTAWRAKEFIRAHDRRTRTRFVTAFKGASPEFELPVDFKKRGPTSLG